MAKKPPAPPDWAEIQMARLPPWIDWIGRLMGVGMLVVSTAVLVISTLLGDPLPFSVLFLVVAVIGLACEPWAARRRRLARALLASKPEVARQGPDRYYFERIARRRQWVWWIAPPLFALSVTGFFVLDRDWWTLPLATGFGSVAGLVMAVVFSRIDRKPSVPLVDLLERANLLPSTCPEPRPPAPPDRGEDDRRRW